MLVRAEIYVASPTASMAALIGPGSVIIRSSIVSDATVVSGAGGDVSARDHVNFSSNVSIVSSSSVIADKLKLHFVSCMRSVRQSVVPSLGVMYDFQFPGALN